MPTAGFSDIVNRLDEFVSLCGRLGSVRKSEPVVSRPTGLRSSYCLRKPCAFGAVHQAIRSIPKLAADLPWYLVALPKSPEIGTILPFVQSTDPAEIAPALKFVLSGPEMPSEESQVSNQARNIRVLGAADRSQQIETRPQGMGNARFPH